jgi:hypothetical protein
MAFLLDLVASHFTVSGSVCGYVVQGSFVVGLFLTFSAQTWGAPLKSALVILLGEKKLTCVSWGPLSNSSSGRPTKCHSTGQPTYGYLWLLSTSMRLSPKTRCWHWNFTFHPYSALGLSPSRWRQQRWSPTEGKLKHPICKRSFLVWMQALDHSAAACSSCFYVALGTWMSLPWAKTTLYCSAVFVISFGWGQIDGCPLWN